MRHHCAALLMGLTLAAAAQAQPSGVAAERAYAGLVAHPHARDAHSLAGQWPAIVDPYETGYRNILTLEPMEPGPHAYYWDAKPQQPSDRLEYSYDAAGRLRVPGDWNTQNDSLFLYEGTVWYRRHFDDPRTEAERAAGRRLFLHFGGANYETRAWLNRDSLGAHEGGFTPFQFEITEKARPDSNTLVVKVDNQRRRAAVPTLVTDWWNYGGITRDVLLVEVPRTFVRDYLVQLDPDAPDTVAGWVQLDGPEAAGTRVRVRIPEAGLDHEATTDAEGRTAIRFAAPDLRRWSDLDPHRYRVVIEALGEGEPLDQVEENIGFRTVETRGTEILLNGEPVFLRGISMHEEAPGGGRTASAEDARTLLDWARDLGANFVRLAHYPHNEHTVRLADSLGILLWAEVPVYWAIDWEDPATYARAEKQLRELVTRDKNRAAVVLWSVANETPRTEARLSFLGGLIETVRALDPTRLVTAALFKETEGDTIVVNDPLAADLDVLGVNEYVGWYEGLPKRADALVWRTPYDKPLVISEFGGGALAGLHGSENERWTEEYQRDLYEHQVAMLKQIPFLAGTSPWILMDFRSPRRPLAGVQDFWNRKGLLSPQGKRKQAFFVLQAWYEALRAADARRTGNGP